MIWMIIGVPLGFAIIKYNEKIGGMIGDIGWAERTLGAGGTYLFLKILGIVILIFSFIYPLGGCDAFLQTMGERMGAN